MEYMVSKLAHLSGVSARTLRYYDEINLLKPKRISSSGYRIYGRQEVNLLQQILFYRELEFSLDEIKVLIYAEDFDTLSALKDHLLRLTNERQRLDQLILTVKKSIQAEKGEIQMEDREKFEAFKKQMIAENEERYGNEIREKYGEDVIDQSNKKLGNLSVEEYQVMEKLMLDLNQKLAEATELGDPKSELAQKVAQLHQEWIKSAWPDGYYDKQKHYNLSLMYIHDERFKAYYERVAPGAAEFLNKALKNYLDVEDE